MNKQREPLSLLRNVFKYYLKQTLKWGCYENIRVQRKNTKNSDAFTFLRLYLITIYVNLTSSVNEPTFSLNQHILYNLIKKDSFNNTYSINIPFNIQGKINKAKLNTCIKMLIERHEILRKNYKYTNNLIEVSINEIGLPVYYLDSTYTSSFCCKLISRMGVDPLFRVFVIEINDNEYKLIFNCSHLIADGYSLFLLCSELSYLYNSSCNLTSLNSDILQYSDFIEYQSLVYTENYQEYYKFWDQELKLMKSIYFSKNSSFFQATGQIKNNQLNIDGSIFMNLKFLAEQYKTTVELIILSIYQKAIYLAQNESIIAIKIPFINRQNKKIRSIVGYIAHSLIHIMDINTGDSILKILKRNIEKRKKLFKYGKIPLPFILDDSLKEKFKFCNIEYNYIKEFHLSLDGCNSKFDVKSIDKSNHWRSHDATTDLSLTAIEYDKKVDLHFQKGNQLHTDKEFLKVIDSFNLVLVSI